jgi:diguanylate cyclase (GGDEF)-like protein
MTTGCIKPQRAAKKPIGKCFVSVLLPVLWRSFMPYYGNSRVRIRLVKNVLPVLAVDASSVLTIEVNANMTVQDDNSPPYEETGADRRQGLLADNALSLDLVSALAGDRLLTETEKLRLDYLKKSRGSKFFSDLLYSITHQYFPQDVAEGLWTEVLRHKYEMSTALMRNVRIAVATLDYLSNITTNMNSATIVGEHDIAEIVGLSMRDGLTGLFNHTYFYQQIDMEVRRYVRYDTAISLVLIDIDDFKKVNDAFGHQEGDRILAAMGKKLASVARDSDICCRYGGEEFAIILPMTDVDVACVIADRLRTELVAVLPDGRTMATVSMGVASCGEKTRTSQELVKKADRALYQAKKNGKNRVVIADETLNSD